MATKSTALPASTSSKTATKALPATKAVVTTVLTRSVSRLAKGVDHGPAKVAGRGYYVYLQSKGIDEFVTEVHDADPLTLIETERKGVAGVFVKDLSKRMEIPAQRMFDILGVPKATAEKKVAAGELLTGNGGRAALGVARLLGIAKEIVENSTAPAARDFDSTKWLGQWLEKKQPALGGRRPSELIDTPTGLDVVAKLLGSIESGAYQ